MDLSLNVSGLGPLSQVGLHIVNFDTAVHLATGAIGWWKSRSRSLSLAESISAQKASLVCASTFNVVTYRERRRQTGLVRGLAVQNDNLCSIPGSIEQTAVLNNAGIDCLRALTTGLLCFYSVQKVSTILADIIPFGMLHPDQDDEVPVFEGPLLTSLRDWVASVADEEDHNTYRRHLLELTSRGQKELTGTEIACLSRNLDDTNYLLGALRWMVSPRHRRSPNTYPTRSLHVWRVAVVLAELAFDISASLEPIHSLTQYKDFMRGTEGSGSFPDVALVMASVGDTDPWLLQQVDMESLALRPQVVPILSIPHMVFNHIGLEDTSLHPEELVEMWNVSFKYAKKAVGAPSLLRGGNVLLPASKDAELIRENHKHLAGIWSPHLARILRPAMDLYVPGSCNDESWSQTEILSYFQRRRSGEPTISEDNEVRDNVHKLSAIFLGSIYGACLQSLIPLAESDAKSQSEYLEIAFSPEQVIGDKLFRWTAAVGLALGGLLEASRWTGLLLELVTGIEHVQPLDQQPSAGLLGRRLNVINQTSVFQESHVRVSDIFGVQANGVFAISALVVRPSSDANDALTFHVGAGRILNLPVDGSGYLRASQVIPAALEMHLHPEPQLELLSRRSGTSSTPEVFRVDAEPHWEVNAQSICFTIRSGGIPVSILNISKVLERLHNWTVRCTCGQPQTSVTVPRSERWQAVTAYQILRPNYPGSSRLAACIRDEDKVLVDVDGDDVKRILVVGVLQCRKMAICRDCVRCAYNRIKNREKKESVALIVG